MSEIRFGLAKPPDGKKWCGVCFAFYKAAVIGAHGDKIREIEQDGKDDIVWLHEPKGMLSLPPLQLPVMTGTSMVAPVLGTTDLCESHAPALVPQTSRLAIGQGPLPPGLTMGRG